MELVRDIYYAALKDGSWIVDQYIGNDSLERRLERPTNIVSRAAIFQRDSARRVHFLMFMVWPMLLCSRTRYASISYICFLP